MSCQPCKSALPTQLAGSLGIICSVKPALLLFLAQTGCSKNHMHPDVDFKEGTCQCYDSCLKNGHYLIWDKNPSSVYDITPQLLLRWKIPQNVLRPKQSLTEFIRRKLLDTWPNVHQLHHQNNGKFSPFTKLCKSVQCGILILVNIASDAIGSAWSGAYLLLRGSTAGG